MRNSLGENVGKPEAKNSRNEGKEIQGLVIRKGHG